MSEQWKQTQLGKVCEIILGQSPSSETYNQDRIGLPFFQGKSEFGTKYAQAKTWCSEPLKTANKNDILISVRAPVGESNLAPDYCCIGRGLSALRADQKNLLQEFLWHQIEFKKNYLQGISQGSTFDAISGKDLSELEIDIPPLPEQKKIAEILSGIDKAIESQCAEIDKISTMHRIACQQKISDLSHNSETATIGSISNKIMDYRGKSPPKHETGVPLITAKNIRKGFIEMNPAEFIQEDLYGEWMAKGIPISGDILVTTEAPLGNVAIAPSSKFAIGQRVICISPNRKKITSEYLLACMKTDDFQGQLTASSTGSTVSGVRQGVLLDCNIPLPAIEWQRRIGSFDLNASKLITALTAKKAKLTTLKQSLSADLLSGRKRVSI